MKDERHPADGADLASAQRKDGREAILEVGRRVMKRSDEALRRLAGTERPSCDPEAAAMKDCRTLRSLASDADLLDDHMREKYEGEEDGAVDPFLNNKETEGSQAVGRYATIAEQLEAGRRVMDGYSEALQRLADTRPSPNPPPVSEVSAGNRTAGYYWVRLRSAPELWEIGRYDGVDSWFLTGGEIPMPDETFQDVADRVQQPVSVRPTSYDTDFFQWTQETAAKVRQRRFDEVDVSALAEEIEDLGKREQRQVSSRLRMIIIHMLKLQFQPDKSTKAWINSIDDQRIELEQLFRNSGSLRKYGRDDLPYTYSLAVRKAVLETGLPKRTFPAECPYTYEQILDPDFYGDTADGSSSSQPG